MCQIHYLRHQGSESLIFLRNIQNSTNRFDTPWVHSPQVVSHLWRHRDWVNIFPASAQMNCNSGSKKGFMPLIKDVECECIQWHDHFLFEPKSSQRKFSAKKKKHSPILKVIRICCSLNLDKCKMRNITHFDKRPLPWFLCPYWYINHTVIDWSA